jgi:hypothetical protein
MEDLNRDVREKFMSFLKDGGDYRKFGSFEWAREQFVDEISSLQGAVDRALKNVEYERRISFVSKHLDEAERHYRNCLDDLGSVQEMWKNLCEAEQVKERGE